MHFNLYPSLSNTNHQTCKAEDIWNHAMKCNTSTVPTILKASWVGCNMVGICQHVSNHPQMRGQINYSTYEYDWSVNARDSMSTRCRKQTNKQKKTNSKTMSYCHFFFIFGTVNQIIFSVYCISNYKPSKCLKVINS